MSLSVAASDKSGLLPLSSIPFTSGRAATDADVKTGAAVFVLKDGNTPIGKPIPIKLPQYSYFNDKGKKTLVVVIQAEEAYGKKLVGAVDANGGQVAGFITDFELLGETQP